MKNLKIVHKRLNSLTKNKPVFDDEVGLYRLRIGVPATRKSLYPDYSFISDSKKVNILNWNKIWNFSDLFEAKSQALYFYQYKSLDYIEFKTICTWVKTCTCWEHSDDLSKIIADVTEEHPDWTIGLLTKWVKSNINWQRRQSLIGLLEYSKKRKVFLPFETYIENIKSLLNDKDYYVQKAVGWTLREVYNIYPKKCLQFLKNNIHRIKPMAYSTATEKLDNVKKIKLNSLKKKQIIPNQERPNDKKTICKKIRTFKSTLYGFNLSYS